ncbi:DUF3137 domain-containing protein [Microbacterium marinilacus]|uniref:DUF3137 domain-containing protein n=1 Tax=Microbacterium marinilacus TaxID=415209 RepID=UPI001C8D08F7|nr:DUF3137 domain-containing protein [Microbacterium marinilacus]MBY0688019.1 DUF3137 domain-containing protein [Microbacterium marinilacus]
MFLLVFWAWVIGEDGFARAQLSEWLLYGTGAVVYSVIPVLIIFHAVRDWPGAGGRTQFRLDRFARANGMTYRPVRHNARPGLPGMIFDAAWQPGDVDVLTRYDATGLIVGNARFTTGTGKGRTVHKWGYASVQLGTRLPHIVLDARGNNSLAGHTNLPRDLDPRQRLRLEGDFDRYFTLYCPRDYERDALYLFTPDIMARFVDHAAEFDVEIVDDRLFLYAKRPLATLDPETWEWLRATLAVLTEKVEQWRRWRDDRLGTTRVDRRGRMPIVTRPPKGVAAPGRRLTDRTSWWGVLAIVLATAVLWAIGTDVFGLFG